MNKPKEPKTKPRRLESWLLHNERHHFRFPHLEHHTYVAIFATITFLTVLALYLLYIQ